MAYGQASRLTVPFTDGRPIHLPLPHPSAGFGGSFGIPFTVPAPIVPADLARLKPAGMQDVPVAQQEQQQAHAPVSFTPPTNAVAANNTVDGQNTSGKFYDT